MRWLAIILIGVSALWLNGCAFDQDSEAEIAALESSEELEPEVVYTPEEGLTSRARLRKAISLLEVGQAGQAKAELEAYLLDQPNSGLARDLITQIDADPQELFGPKFYTYKMKSGESLSIVAKDRLGNAMKFYGLARYNDIENPSEIKAGQIVKVPGSRPPEPAISQLPDPEPAVESDDEPEQVAISDPSSDDEVPATSGEDGQEDEASESSTDDDQTQVANIDSTESTQSAESAEIESEVQHIQDVILTAQEQSNKGDYLGAANFYEDGILQYPDDLNMKQLAAANYVNYADQLSSTGRPGEAATMLRRAGDLNPGDSIIGERLANLERQDKAQDLYNLGITSLTADKPIEALDQFNQALIIDPDHLGAKEKIEELNPVVAEQWHKEAMGYFRRQDLDQAVAVWDKVLDIAPTHSQAQLHRAQALELKDQLERLTSPE